MPVTSVRPALRHRVQRQNLKAKKARARRRWFALVPLLGSGAAFYLLTMPLSLVVGLPLAVMALFLLLWQGT